MILYSELPFAVVFLQSPPISMHTLDFAGIRCYGDRDHLLMWVPMDFSTIILDDNFIYMFRMMKRVGSRCPSSSRTLLPEIWPRAMERRYWRYKSLSWECNLKIISKWSLTEGARKIAGWLFFFVVVFFWL